MTDFSWEKNLAKVAGASSAIHGLLALMDGDKSALLDEVNRLCETKYNVNHLNNWLANRVPEPSTVTAVCRIKVLHRCLPQDLVDKLWRVF